MNPASRTAWSAFLLFLAAAAPSATASDPPDAAALQALRKAKLEEPFARALPWTLDFATARAEAQRRQVPILAYFTRSYAPCPPCKKVEWSVFENPAFAEVAREHVLYLNVESRVDGEPDRHLDGRYGGLGTPRILFLDPEGGVLVRHDGAQTADVIAAGSRFSRLSLALWTAKDPQAPELRIPWLLEGVTARALPLQEATTWQFLLKAHLDEAQTARVKTAIDTMRIEFILNDTLILEHDALKGQRLRQLAQKGVIPPDESDVAPPFWYRQMTYAQSIDDLALAEEILNEARTRLANHRYKNLVRDYEEILAKMHAAHGEG